MTIRIGVTFISCSLILASSAYAQTGPGLFANFDLLLPKTTPVGSETRIGSIYHLDQQATPTRLGTNLNTTTNFEPLTVAYPERYLFKGNGGAVRRNGWGFSVAAFGYKNSGSIEGTVTSSRNDRLNHNVSGVAQWGSPIPVALNPLHPSGHSPVAYGASTTLELQQLDARAVRNFCFRSCSLSVSGGVSFANAESTRNEGQVQRAFIPDRRTPTGIIDDISLLSESKSSFRGWGPVIGVDLSFNVMDIGALHIRGSHAIIVGAPQEEGLWVERERGTLGVLQSNGLAQGPELFTTRTTIPMEPESRRANVQVSDLQVGFRFRFAGDCLEIGPTLNLSRFGDLPVAPAWNIPMSAPLTASSWKSNKADITVKSIALSFGVRF